MLIYQPPSLGRSAATPLAVGIARMASNHAAAAAMGDAGVHAAFANVQRLRQAGGSLPQMIGNPAAAQVQGPQPGFPIPTKITL